MKRDGFQGEWTADAVLGKCACYCRCSAAEDVELNDPEKEQWCRPWCKGELIGRHGEYRPRRYVYFVQMTKLRSVFINFLIFNISIFQTSTANIMHVNST